MKRIISILTVLVLFTSAIFCQDSKDDEEYDDGFVYETNGAGDQFLKIDLGANIPLNFGDKLYVGGGLSVGYYYFLNQNFALGGNALVGYNLSIGKKSLISVPITFGAMFQPTIGKFEFPLFLDIGFATLSCQTMMYFPALAAKASAGAYFRYSDSWSFGISTTAYLIPQFFLFSQQKPKPAPDCGIFTNVGLSIRYHF